MGQLPLRDASERDFTSVNVSGGFEVWARAAGRRDVRAERGQHPAPGGSPVPWEPQPMPAAGNLLLEKCVGSSSSAGWPWKASSMARPLQKLRRDVLLNPCQGGDTTPRKCHVEWQRAAEIPNPASTGSLLGPDTSPWTGLLRDSQGVVWVQWQNAVTWAVPG